MYALAQLDESEDDEELAADDPGEVGGVESGSNVAPLTTVPLMTALKMT